MDFANTINWQKSYFQTGATRPLAFRQAMLAKLADALKRCESDLFAALHADLRKSPQESFTTEVGFVLSEIEHTSRHLRQWAKRRRKPAPLIAWPSQAFVQPEPYGIALIMGPWNYPVQLLLTPLVAAIAAGNCAVLKPSEMAPHCSEAVAKIIQSIFPTEFVAVAEGNADVAHALLELPFDKIFFTGSTAVGRSVMAAAAQHLTPITLELGGKSPCLVCADAPIKTTARRIVWGKFLNAGQTCTAPDFVMVDRRVSHELLEAFQAAITEFYGTNPRFSSDYGRIINRRHFDRLNRLMQAGKMACGGESDADDLYVAPTILTDTPWDSPVLQDEIFGPILPVVTFDTMEDALALLAPRPVPLALYLFTRDRAVQEFVLSHARSGGVCINDTLSHMLGKQLPFGGLGASGMGAYHGQASFEAFSHQRSVLRRSFAIDPALRYPPPKASFPMLKKAFRFLMRD